MIHEPELLAVLGVVLGAVLVMLRNLWMARRQRLRERRQEQLRATARRCGLTYLERTVPAHVEERARLFRGQDHDIGLDEVLAGSDAEGLYHLMQREVCGERHRAMVFETRSATHLEGFQVEPVAPQGCTGLRRLMGRILRRSPGSWKLRLVWESEPQRLLENRTLGIGAQILSATAEIAEDPHGMVLGVAVRDRQILIHAVDGGEVDDLVDFVEAARRLRAFVLPIVHDSRNVRLAAQAGVSRAHPPVTVEEPAPEPRPRSAQDPVEEVLSAFDLVRDPHPPTSSGIRRRKKNKGFEIPEPEEQVVVLSGRVAHRG